MANQYTGKTLETLYAIFDSIQPNDNGCCLYPYSPGGYAGSKINRKYSRVHRLSLERKLGRSLKLGYYALHTCDNKSCINPSHLYEGTPKDNKRDHIERNPQERIRLQQLSQQLAKKPRTEKQLAWSKKLGESNG